MIKTNITHILLRSRNLCLFVCNSYRGVVKGCQVSCFFSYHNVNVSSITSFKWLTLAQQNLRSAYPLQINSIEEEVLED